MLLYRLLYLCSVKAKSPSYKQGNEKGEGLAVTLEVISKCSSTGAY
jgi:hypothetical protein